MSANANDILHQLANLGAKVERQGNTLLLEAGGAPVPGDIITMIRAHKDEVLQALSHTRSLKCVTSEKNESKPHLPHEFLNAADLRNRYEESAAICEFDGRQDRPRAESRAWNEVAGIWYRQHGTKVPHHLCAGCGKPISDSDKVLLMPHGERAHAGTVQRCIIAYRRRRKAEAADALAAIGIPTPPKYLAKLGDSVDLKGADDE